MAMCCRKKDLSTIPPSFTCLCPRSPGEHFVVVYGSLVARASRLVCLSRGDRRRARGRTRGISISGWSAGHLQLEGAIDRYYGNPPGLGHVLMPRDVVSLPVGWIPYATGKGA